MLTKFVNLLLAAVSIILSWLPPSPFADTVMTLQNSEGLGWLAWFFPVHEALELTAKWIAAIALYYLASIALRWVKAIE